GDVGFGKTEVAIRAAFKSVMGGKQVAVLVPTTVLAQQHFNTFRERMADYPVRIELLSRFRTPREQKRVLQDLAAGSVDIVIGTPPQDRLPVDTIVTQYDERLIRDAIQHEINRQGQVFYLHNRVFDIDEVATRLRTLLPKARIVVGHGQMDSDELEDVMTRFV